MVDLAHALNIADVKGVLAQKEARVVGLDLAVVQLSLVNHGDRLALYTLLETTTLPLPKEIDKLSPDPGAYNEYVKFLDSPAWGMRWYGARRLGFIENKAAIPILREKMRSEEHKDVLNELGKAIERLK